MKKDMTLNELLQVVDKDTRIQVQLKMFGLYFKTSRYKEFLKKDETKEILNKEIETIRTIVDENICTLQIILK
nr:MAG TPA: hypothetical protein [Caudoviricetes sp.]